MYGAISSTAAGLLLLSSGYRFIGWRRTRDETPLEHTRDEFLVLSESPDYENRMGIGASCRLRTKDCDERLQGRCYLRMLLGGRKK